MIIGSCLCQAVAYEADQLASPIGLCHCRTCQKAHASAFIATARVRRGEFRWTKGADVVAAFESTPGKNRWFCPRCGSHMMAEWKDADQVILRIGTVESGLDTKPVVHIWMAHANALLEAPDGIPQFPEGAPK